MLCGPVDYAVGSNAIDDIVTRAMVHGSDGNINRLSKRIATEKDQYSKAITYAPYFSLSIAETPNNTNFLAVPA